MSALDTLVGDIAGRFGLGSSAGPLVREVLSLVTGSPGGIGGFLEKVRTAGLGNEVASWLGHADAAPLAVQQVERVVGTTVLGGIASRLGLGGPVVSTAIGYLLPKLIGLLTPGGHVPTGVPAEAAHFLAASPASQQPAAAWAAGATDHRRRNRWLLPLLGAAAVLAGLAAYFFWPGSTSPLAPVASEGPAVQPGTPVTAQPARLVLNNDAGTVHVSGAVQDDATRSSIMDTLKSVFGADKVQGDLTIDPARTVAPWLGKLRAVLENFRLPGLQAVLDGNAINLGGISDMDRDRILEALKGLSIGGISFGTLAAQAAGAASAGGDRLAELVSAANTKATAALTSLHTDFSASDLVGVLNTSIVNFPTDGAEVPESATKVLHDAAAQIRKLPSGTVLEIAGYTDNSGDAAANVALSQRRAEAVRDALVHDGVDPSMLVAKGYGSSDAVADNNTEEGRLRNRRIEYHVIKS